MARHHRLQRAARISYSPGSCVRDSNTKQNGFIVDCKVLRRVRGWVWISYITFRSECTGEKSVVGNIAVIVVKVI